MNREEEKDYSSHEFPGKCFDSFILKCNTFLPIFIVGFQDVSALQNAYDLLFSGKANHALLVYSDGEV